MMGMDLGFPDVWLTPPTALPIPYPKTGMGQLGVPSAYNILFMWSPAHNLLTSIPLTLGDQAGVMLGVCSGMVMGPDRPDGAQAQIDPRGAGGGLY
jgi:hypothetical protein